MDAQSFCSATISDCECRTTTGLVDNDSKLAIRFVSIVRNDANLAIGDRKVSKLSNNERDIAKIFVDDTCPFLKG